MRPTEYVVVWVEQEQPRSQNFHQLEAARVFCHWEQESGRAAIIYRRRNRRPGHGRWLYDFEAVA